MTTEKKEAPKKVKLNKEGLQPGVAVSEKDYMRVINEQRAKARAKDK